MNAGGGSRFLLTCAMTRYEHCADWDREELRSDVARVVSLFCGDFLPETGRYTHADVLGESPTSVELRDRLRDFCLSPDRHPDDYIIIYLTGHGEILDDGDFVILTSDTNPSDLLNRTVPAGEIVRLALANTRVRRLLLLLDTCYAGQGGADMALQALRRIGDPPKRSADQDQTSAGSGVVMVAATRPFERALPGMFTTYLDRAARSLEAGGSAVRTLRVGALMGVMKSYKDRPKSQSPEWHQVGMSGDEPWFILNPRYRSDLVDADLLEQEQARYAEQLRARFLPATRWFTGRHAALADLAGWLDNSAGPRVLVVTGHAGSGKTALLGLLAALSDPDQAPTVPRDQLPAGFAISPGAITTAIYAGTMTTSQIRDRIAAAAKLPAHTTGELIDGLSRPGTGALTVLIDALDEAADPADLVNGLIRPLMQEPRSGLRLLLGTRPPLLEPRLLGKPEAGHYLLVDLDQGQYADPASMRAYIRRILLSEDPLDSAYKPSGLYRTAPAGTLAAVSEAIGEAAGTSFLVARITAATEATTAALPDPAGPAWRHALPRYAGPAMRRDLSVRLRGEADKAAQLLLPLAYARGGGLPWEDIWPRLADALSPGHGYGNDDLIWLRRTAGSYAVEGIADGRSVYRLYHQALADHLLEQRDQRADQQAITSTLLSLVPPGGSGTRDWPRAHPYIRAHLATHAAQAGCIDDLLADPAYLLTAGRPQLLAAADEARSKPARAAADAYRRAAHHLRIAPAEQHASYLQLAARCGRAPQLADALENALQRGTWSCTWASWRLEPPHRALTGHPGRVNAVTAAELDDRPVVISGGDDGSVRVWDLAAGAPVGQPFTGHVGPVYAVAAATMEGRPVVISGGDDGSVRVWDLATGALVRVCDRGVSERAGRPVAVRADQVYAVTGVTMGGRPVVISGGNDWMVRVWDPATGDLIRDPFTGHTGPVRAVAAAMINGRPAVVSGSDDRTVRAWDLATGEPVGDPFTGHTGDVYAVTAAELDDRPVIISGSDDQTLRVWDLATSPLVRDPFTGHTGPVYAVTAAELGGRPVVVSGSDDRTVRAWNLATGDPVGDPFRGHTGDVYAVTAAELGGRPVVISGSDDRTLRVWDLTTGTGLGGPFTGHAGPVRAVTAAEPDGRPVVISGSDDRTVRVWDLATGDPVGDPFTGHTGDVYAVTAAELDGRPVVISGSDDRTVRVWDLATGDPVGDPFTGHDGPVRAVAAAELDGRPVVISGGDDGSVRVWDLATGAVVGAPFTGHAGWVYAVTAAELDGRPVVVSGADDGSVRVWGLATGEPVGGPFTGHTGAVYAVTAAELDGRLVVVSGRSDRTLRAWDLATGDPVGDPFTGHTGDVYAVTAAELDGRPVVISGADDASVRVWDLATGAVVGGPLTGHTGWVYAVTAAELDGRPVVISGADDASVRVWDLATGAVVGGPLTGHTGDVYAVTAAELDGRPVVISGADDASVRVWDLATGEPVGGPLTAHTGAVYAVAAAELDHRPVIISGGDDRTVLVWDVARRRPMRYRFRPIRLDHEASVRAAVPIQREDRLNVITGCRDGVSRRWDLPGCRTLSRITTHGGTGISAMVTLTAEHVLYANSRTISLYEAANIAEPIQTIELDSEIHALVAHGPTTVVAATRLGIVTLEIPH